MIKLLLLSALLSTQPRQPHPNAVGVVVGRDVRPFEVLYYETDSKGYKTPVYGVTAFILLVRSDAGDTVKLSVPVEYYNTKLGSRIKFYNPNKLVTQ
jgi:hypothetical protein